MNGIDGPDLSGTSVPFGVPAQPALSRPAGSTPRPSPAPPRRTAARRAGRPGRRSRSRAGWTRTPRAAPGAPPRVRRARPGPRPRDTSTSRSAARATSPSYDPNGATVATSACTSAASISARATVVERQHRRPATTSARRPRPSPDGRRCRCRPRARAAGRTPGAATAGSPAPATAATCSAGPRPARPRRPDPSRTSSRLDVEPASTADAWAPRSSDSPVCPGSVRRSPRSRSSASMPSRVAANADGTPSRDTNQARGSACATRGTLSGSVEGHEAAARRRRSFTVTGERLSFGGVADRYDRARPAYPREAAAWLVGDAAGPGARARGRHRQAHPASSSTSATR